MTRSAIAVAGLLAFASVAPADSPPEKLWVYIGTYNTPKSKGIYRAELDLATGKLGEPELAAEATNPSFLAIAPSGKFLYAVGEVGEFKGKKTGAVTAFALDPKTGDLKRLNSESAGGSGPCHISVNKAGTHAFVANYGGGSCAALPIGKDGSLGEATSFHQHKGTSVVKSRRSEPHAHSINLDPNNKFAFVADLGLDKVLVYAFDAEKGTLTPNTPPAVKLADGAGPRHFAFHPSGKFAFVINELDSTLTSMEYDEAKGVLRVNDTVTTLPGGKFQGNSTAEVVVHPSGKFVYGSNRGHNSIAVFAFDEATGKLTPKGHQGDGVKVPRNFNIDPTGKFMLVANQDGDSVIVFAIDPKTGALTPTGSKIEVGKPVCVKFLPVAR